MHSNNPQTNTIGCTVLQHSVTSGPDDGAGNEREPEEHAQTLAKWQWTHYAGQACSTLH